MLFQAVKIAHAHTELQDGPWKSHIEVENTDGILSPDSKYSAPV